MTDLILHKNKEYIDDDLNYYFSGQRDVNNKIRPKESIYSLTPDSTHFDIDFNDKKVGSLFFPIAPYSVDRIYIGISFPLFANNWGAALLRYLMTRVKPDGCVILPVYPEMQAFEKNFWSRSVLENTFLSRSRWKGTSNIWAENDGVMSLRIGRQFPLEIKSTASYFFEEAGNCIIRRSLQGRSQHSTKEHLLSMGQWYWNSANAYSIIERIIHDYFGMKEPLMLGEISNGNGLITLECLFSSYINIIRAVSLIPNKASANDIVELLNRYHVELQGRFTAINSITSDTLNDLSGFNVICLINVATNDTSSVDMRELLDSALERLATGGVLIVHESQGLPDDLAEMLDSYPNINYYSSIVASKLQSGEVISHYSSIVEEELVTENHDRKCVFRVIQK